MKILRVAFFIITLFMAFSMPWWVAFTLSVVGLSLLSFPEMIVIGFTLDMLYGQNEPFYSRFMFLVIFLIIYLVSIRAKTYVNFSK